MDEKHVLALRKVALLGGIDDYIALSSGELGKILGTSQQSASKRILELLEEGLITRDLGARKQRMRLTPKGVDVLRREFNEYRRIFMVSDTYVLHGRVSSGMGEGGYYITQKGYMDQFEAKLGYKPFQGTFNVVLDKEDLSTFEMIRSGSGIRIDGFTSEGRSFGDVIAYKAKIRNIDCAIVVPERSHYVDTIEIICKYHLRRTLSIENDDRVDVKVES